VSPTKKYKYFFYWIICIWINLMWNCIFWAIVYIYSRILKFSFVAFVALVLCLIFLIWKKITSQGNKFFSFFKFMYRSRWLYFSLLELKNVFLRLLWVVYQILNLTRLTQYVFLCHKWNMSRNVENMQIFNYVFGSVMES
jgi:hypothetical protein